MRLDDENAAKLFRALTGGEPGNYIRYRSNKNTERRRYEIEWNFKDSRERWRQYTISLPVNDPFAFTVRGCKANPYYTRSREERANWRYMVRSRVEGELRLILGKEDK
jgi:hypothetical protein